MLCILRLVAKLVFFDEIALQLRVQKKRQPKNDCRLVGMTRFELATPATRTRCATKLRYIPKDEP